LYHGRGTAHLDLKDPERAIEEFSEAIDLSPKDAELLSSRGDAHLDQALGITGDGRRMLTQLLRAMQDLDEAITLDPHLTNAHHSRAIVNTLLRKDKEAEEDLQKAVEPGMDADPLRNLIEMLKSQRSDTETPDVLANATDQDLERIILLSDPEAAISYFLSDPEAAISYFERAIGLRPEDPRAWYSRGYALSRSERFEEALADLNEAIRLKPSPEAWARKAVILNSLGQDDGALEASEAALGLDPDSAEAWYTKGHVLRGLRRFSEAVESLGRAIESRPDNSAAWCDRAVVLDEMGRSREALADVEEALRLSPGFAGAWDAKMIITVGLGKSEEALEAAEKLLELEPENVRALAVRDAALQD